MDEKILDAIKELNNERKTEETDEITRMKREILFLKNTYIIFRNTD